jgi:hypothetical protein
MAEENTTPTRRGRKPRSVAPEEDPKVEEVQAEETSAAEKAEEPKEKPQAQNRVRVVERGADIEVDTDENGVALETVWRESSLPGSKQVTHILVVSKGTLYKK